MRPLKDWVKRNFADLLYSGMKKSARKQALLDWLEKNRNHSLQHPADISFNIFTYHGEDGIIAWLIEQLKDVKPVFVDIGSGNCIISNCSMLAFHFNWKGVFIDKDEKQIAVGRKFYKSSDGDGLNFISAEITPQNINPIIAGTGIEGEVGLVSIDVDGNDYWLWKQLEQVRPRILIIEAKVEFGLEDKVVPYGAKNHRSVDLRYNGASVAAMQRLGKEKGYKLVAANKQGYNLFFVQERESIPELSLEKVLSDKGTINSFYPDSFFREHKFAKE